MSEVIRIVDRGGVVGVPGSVDSGQGVLLPVPSPAELSGGAVSIRDAVVGDMPFMDDLQKRHKVAVGFMFTAQLRGHIEQGHVLIAEAPGSGGAAEPVGYCVGVDKYFKREDTGVIYQMNIVPGRQRGLVGTSLLRAMFERSAYGVRLFCCWCAQDLEANRFWEAMGFVPLAFRTGSRKKSWVGADGVRHKGPRVHIFWQKPVRAEDVALLREGKFRGWWFPSQTGSGAMREDRIVLPIPPGTSWADAKPTVLPGVDSVFGEIAAQREDADRLASAECQRLPEGKEEREQRRAAKQAAQQAAAARSASVASGGLHFGPTPGSPGSGGAGAGGAAGDDDAKRKRQEARKRAQSAVSKKNDPKLVAMARELRDRWLEHVAAQPGMLGSREGGKYDVGRRIEGVSVHGARARGVEVVEVVEANRLDAA